MRSSPSRSSDLFSSASPLGASPPISVTGDWRGPVGRASRRFPHGSRSEAGLACVPMELELGRVTDRKPPFKFASLTRVGFSDTDAQGIVYYGRYLPYFDAARVEYHRHLDMLRL